MVVNIQWFNCIKNDIDLIEDSQVFNINAPFERDDLNALLDAFRNRYKTKTLRNAFKDALNYIAPTYPIESLKQELRGATGLKNDFKSYEETIFSRFAKNQLTLIGVDLSVSNQIEMDYSSIIDKAKLSIENLDNCISSDDEMTKERAKDEIIQRIQEMHDPNSNTFIKTGINDLDRMINGFKKRNHIVIGARPSIGKTAIGVSIMVNACANGKKVAFVSVEMTKDQIFERAVYNKAQLNSDCFDDAGKITDELVRFSNTSDEIINDDNYIFVNPERKYISDVSRSIRRCKRENPDLNMVIVDYIQKIRTTQKTDMEYLHIKEVSETLTSLCKKLDIVMVSLAQLNRDSEKGGQETFPKLHNLKGSSDIEQDADLIILIHRLREAQQEAQKDGSTFISIGKEKEAQTLDSLQALLIVEKNRNGKTGLIPVKYDAPVMRFYDRTISNSWSNEDAF